MDMDKLSNYKEIVKALRDKRGSINDTAYDNMLKKLNIIEISPINETTVKIFEDYTKTELNDSNTKLIIDNINKYGKIRIYGDFFRRILPGTVAYTNASKVARLFRDEEYLLNRYTRVVDLIVAKRDKANTKKLTDIRARVLNDFHKYIKVVLKGDKHFNFSNYYQRSEFSDDSIVIKSPTLKYTGKYAKDILRML